MMKMRQVVYGLALAMLSSTSFAIEIAISATEAYDKAKNHQALLIDVRDPVEIMFTGFTDSVHINIPYLLVDRTRWDEKRNVFRLYQNPSFVREIEQALQKHGWDKNTEIITLCRSGSERGEPSAAFLRQQGFQNARYVVHGFQGDALKEGEKKGFRIQNGWQNSGLPWSPKMNAEKIYRNNEPAPKP